jgi:hypothetical protein
MNTAAVAANVLTQTQITTLVADDESTVAFEGRVGKSFNVRRVTSTVAMTTASAVRAVAGMLKSQMYCRQPASTTVIVINLEEFFTL